MARPENGESFGSLGACSMGKVGCKENYEESIKSDFIQHVLHACRDGVQAAERTEGTELRVSTAHTGCNVSPSWRNENVDTSAEALGRQRLILRDTKEMASLEQRGTAKSVQWGRRQAQAESAGKTSRSVGGSIESRRVSRGWAGQ